MCTEPKAFFMAGASVYRTLHSLGMTGGVRGGCTQGVYGGVYGYVYGVISVFYRCKRPEPTFYRFHVSVLRRFMPVSGSVLRRFTPFCTVYPFAQFYIFLLSFISFCSVLFISVR